MCTAVALVETNDRVKYSKIGERSFIRLEPIPSMEIGSEADSTKIAVFSMIYNWRVSNAKMQGLLPETCGVQSLKIDPMFYCK